MNDALIAGLLVLSLFLILGSGVWIGLTLSGVAWIGMQLFTSRPAGDAMAVTIWGASSSWTLTALPLFILMGEILFEAVYRRICSVGLRRCSVICPAGYCTRMSWDARSLRLSQDQVLLPAPRSAR